MADKLLSALSLCKKAGALAEGFDAVEGALKSGRAALLLFAKDISAGTKKRAITAKPKSLPALTLPYEQKDLAILTRRPVGVLAVTNEDLAVLVHKNIAPSAKEEPV